MTELLISLITLAVIALLIIALVERFSPDATITYVVKLVVFGVVLIVLLKKLLPMLSI